MPDPRWEAGLGRSGTLLRQRQPGLDSAEDFRVTQTESNRRVRDSIAQAETPAQKAATPRITQGAPIELPKPPPAPAIIDRFHKWARYVIVAKPHFGAEDPVTLPAYSDSIAEGYAKASAIATRDNARVPLIVIGGGGVYAENVALSDPLVDLFGWGNPIVEGNCSITTIGNPIVDGLTFHSPASGAGFAIPQTGAPIVDPSPTGVPRVYRCNFYGRKQAFYAQRMFYAEGCTFWQEPLADGSFVNPSLEIAPVMIEMETPQRWWSVMKNCRLYTGVSQGTPGANGIPVNTSGYAIKVSSGPLGTAPMPNLISGNGVFRTNAGAGASGALQSGVMLDGCEIYGSARVREWTLAHEHCMIYGGLSIPERSGGAYAWVSGHDYLDATDNFNGRQFGIVLFDGCNVHSTLITYGVADPNGRAGFFGGVAAFFRNSQHLERFDGAAAAAMRNTGANTMEVETAMSATPCAAWGVGAGVALSDSGSQLGVQENWHPFYA